MTGRTHAAAALLVGVLATAGGVALAAWWGSHTPRATANGRADVAEARGRGVRLRAGRYPAVYCGAYANVATQTGVVFAADLGGGLVLTLADSAVRGPGPRDPARVTLALTGAAGGGRYAWGPGRGGTAAVVGEELRAAEVDANLVGPAGDTLAVRARFACDAPRYRRPGGGAPGR
jgi:hypothetical protein